MRFEDFAIKVKELQKRGILLVEDGNHGEYRPRRNEFVAQGVSFIRAADINGGRILFGSASCINDAARARIRKGIGQPGDILLTHKGTVGKVAMAPQTAPPFVCSPQTTFWRVLDDTILDRWYLYAYLQSPQFHSQLDARKGETDMAGYVSLTAQRDLMIPLPDIEIQRSIGCTLRLVHERLTLLDEMNSTLESIAQAIFKSWFIDFDPVHAKAAGQDPEGMDAEAAALFPSEFEDSALGPIPKGWRVGTIGDIAENIRRQIAPEKADPTIPYIGLGHMPRGSIALDSWGSADGLQSGKLMFQTNEILFGRLRPYFHKVGIAPGVGICSTDILVLRPISDEVKGFLTMHVSSNELIDHATRLSTGARMPRVSWEDLASYTIVRAPRNILRAYQRVARPIFDQILGNVHLARTLVALRDTLLPRLISGKLRIPEADELVEEAVS